LVLLLKRVKVPDVDFVLNCSDYPVVKKNDRGKPDVPVISMCGSTRHNDIIVPTYTLALSTIGRGRRANEAARFPWEQRKNQMVWRGSDSNRARFRFNLIANSPEFDSTGLLDVGINAMLRFKHEPEKHGPLKDSIPQQQFGDYKWIANLDGSVAAYRMPAVAALGSTIVKQDSDFMEHWYREFLPWQHYVPMANDFSDLAEVLEWLKSHDAEAQQIGAAGRDFVLKNLQPEHVEMFLVCLPVRMRSANDL